MIRFEVVSKRPKFFERLSGHTLEEFYVLVAAFDSAWIEQRQKERLGHHHQRSLGGGRTPELASIEDKLLFILVYTRAYPTFFVAGLLFGLSEASTCEWFHRLLPSLDRALGYARMKPSRKHGRNLEEILAEFPEIIELGLLADGTERPMRRPKNKDKEKSRFSGKKKDHTVKNVILTHPKTNRVLHLTRTRDGTVHDKKALEEEDLTCHEDILIGLDGGFPKLEIGRARIIRPTYKLPGGELSESNKNQNRAFSSVRMHVEHAIAGIKRSRIATDILRLKDETDADTVMSVATGLHNLRVAHRSAT